MVLGLAGFICYDKFFKDDGGNSSYENKGNVVLSEKEMEQKSKELMELYMRPVIYDFEEDVLDQEKLYTIIFDIKSDGKYVFNDLKEKQFERIYECYKECGYMP